jgi:hypothetical protein
MADVTLSGKVRAGMVYGSGKRFTLTLRSDGLVVHCFKDHELRKDDIVRLQPDGPRWLSRGFRIVHTRADCPRSLYFSCSGGLPRLEAALRESGFGTDKIADDPRFIKPWHLILALGVICFVGNLLFGQH